MWVRSGCCWAMEDVAGSGKVWYWWVSGPLRRSTDNYLFYTTAHLWKISWYPGRNRLREETPHPAASLLSSFQPHYFFLVHQEIKHFHAYTRAGYCLKFCSTGPDTIPLSIMSNYTFWYFEKYKHFLQQNLFFPLKNNSASLHDTFYSHTQMLHIEKISQ